MRSSEHSCQRQSRSQVWRTNNATDNIWIALLVIETPKALNEAVVFTHMSHRQTSFSWRPSKRPLWNVLYSGQNVLPLNPFRTSSVLTPKRPSVQPLVNVLAVSSSGVGSPRPVQIWPKNDHFCHFKELSEACPDLVTQDADLTKYMHILHPISKIWTDTEFTFSC